MSFTTNRDGHPWSELRQRGSRVACRLADAVLAALLAPACAACGRALDAPSGGCVCALCWSLVRRVTPPCCHTCGDPLPSWRATSLSTQQCARCRRHPRLVDRGCAAGEYDGTLRDILHAFKYDGRRSLARPLGALLREAGSAILTGADFAVPVPLHPWRRLTRGFNQAAVLADRLPVPVVHLLARTRPTAPQTGLAAAARRRNVRRAFRLSPALLPHAARALLVDRIVVLVDDVRTTGATLEACAQVLKAGGAREIRALTVARAAPPRGTKTAGRVASYRRADTAA